MFRVPWPGRRGWIVPVLGTCVGLFGAGLVFWRAAAVEREAAREVRAESELPFELRDLDRSAPAGYAAVAAAAAYRDITAFQGGIAVSSRAGLFLYRGDGSLAHWFRVGMELPPAALGPMASGIAAGTNGPELFIPTDGEGLLAFNGSRFRQLLPADPALRNITAVRVLGSGQILLGTATRGSLVFDGRRLKPFLADLKSAHITALAGDDGDLWIGTLANGLFHYRGGRLEPLAAALPDPQVLSLAVRSGTAFAGTPLGVVEFQDGERRRVVADGYFARALDLDGDALSVGTEDEGIVPVALDSRRNRHQDSPGGNVSGAVLKLATLEGSRYALTEDAIYRLDSQRGEWQKIASAPGAVLADRNVASLALSGGRLWVGYFDRGLDIVPLDLETPAHRESDTLFCINRIVSDAAADRTAVATANGLVLFDAGGEPRQVMSRKDGLLADQVTDVAFREGGMVVATPAGLSFVDRSGVRSLYVFQGLVNNHVYTVAVQGRQTLAGTLGGLSVLDDDSVRANYTTANSRLRRNWITALARVGSDWFAGTYGAGVLRLDRDGAWQSFPELKGELIVNPNAMLVDGNRVFAGSLDRGLLVYDRSSGHWTSTTTGLPSKNVTALAAGGGYLYVGTDNGLVRISEGAIQ